MTGHRGETAEIGHLAVRTGVRCACGRDGCVEAIASAAAIARRYTGLSGSHVTGAHDIAARLSTDAVARQVWHDAVEALADGLGIVPLLVGPALVVIGGGLSRAGEALLNPLRVALRERSTVVHPADNPLPKVPPCSLEFGTKSLACSNVDFSGMCVAGRT